MTVTRRPRRSAAQWQRLVAQQAASGLTASAFCDRHDLSYASFIQWRRRLRQGEPIVAAESTAASEPSPPKTLPFIELTAPRELCKRLANYIYPTLMSTVKMKPSSIEPQRVHHGIGLIQTIGQSPALAGAHRVLETQWADAKSVLSAARSGAGLFSSLARYRHARGQAGGFIGGYISTGQCC